MATATKAIDTKIINYLKVLNVADKKTILSVVETFAKVHNDEWSEEEKAELDELKRQHKAGKSKSYTIAQVRENALKAIKNELRNRH